jgi:hypothetical protein
MARKHRTSVHGRQGAIRMTYVASCWCGWQKTDTAQHLARKKASSHEAKKNR